jgi:hypothetical protein
MDKTLKNRLSLLAGNYIRERSSVLVTEDSNVFYKENENKCVNYCQPRGIKYYEITKEDVLEARGGKEKESEPTTKPKRTRRKRTNKED